MKKWIIGSVLLCTLGFGLALVRPEPGFKPQLRVVRTVVIDGLDAYELELSNPAAHEVTYLGYEADEPSLEFQYWAGERWKNSEGFRCGTGLGTHSLPAGDKVLFTMRRPLEVDIRVGIVVTPPDFKYSDIVKFDWLPKRLGEWLVTWQQERNQKRWEELIAWAPPLEVVPKTPAEVTVEEALEEGVVMDWENLMEADPYAAGPPLMPIDPEAAGRDPFAPTRAPAGLDPFAPPSSGMTSHPAHADPFAPAPASASTSP